MIVRLLGAARRAIKSAHAAGRVDHWWYSKVAPVLAVACCAALTYHVSAGATATSIVAIAFVGLCAGTYGHVINDIFDREIDQRAGKRNHMAALSPLRLVLLCLFLVALGALPALFLPYSKTSLILLGVEYLLPTIYSAPPFRLKARGLLGLLCDCLGAHLVPCLYAISVLARHAASPALLHTKTAYAFLCLVGLWSFSLGLIGIVIHEYQDCENDLRSGIRTFATGHPFQDVRSSIHVLYAVELISFAGLLAVLHSAAPLLAGAILVYVAVVAVRISAHWRHYRNVGDEATLIQWWQLSHPFYELYFPLAVAVQCAWIHPWLAIFPALQAVAFAQTFRKLMPELREFGTQLVLRGRLDLDGDAAARAKPRFSSRPCTRVEIQHGGRELWDVRVARRGVRVSMGKTYVMKLQVRADQPRAILFGVWQDHSPWGGAGLCEEIQVSTRWQMVRRSFIAQGDHPSTYLGIWMGRETPAVEFRKCSIRARYRPAGRLL